MIPMDHSDGVSPERSTRLKKWVSKVIISGGLFLRNSFMKVNPAGLAIFELGYLFLEF